MKLSKEECKKIITFSKSYLIKLLKKVAQVFVILRIHQEKMVIFKKNLKFIKEKI